MLLDTHVLLWLLDDDGRLGGTTRSALQRSAAVHVSAASLWELAIKAELGKVEVPDDLPSRIEDAGLAWLPITPGHTWATRAVALPHRDPFDRLLVAQARVERLPLITADRVLLGAQPGCDVLDARH